MYQSSDTSKRLRFPVALISMTSNTRDRRVSNVLSPRASECKRIGAYMRTSFILQQQLAKQSSVIGGHTKYCLRKFAKLEEAFKNCTIKSQDGRGLGREKVLCEGGFGCLA